MVDSDEYPEFDDVAAILRQGPSDVTGEQPPDSLWERIEAEADLPSLDEARTRRATGQSRSRLIALAVGAVAAVALVAVPVILAIGSSGDGSGSVAAASLEPIGGNELAMGDAQLTGRQLTIDTDGLGATDDGSYELWLLDLEGGELNDLVWIGVLDEDGTFELADDIDLDTFDVVDVSLEPHDGDPTHSGDSILRGQLSAL